MEITAQIVVSSFLAIYTARVIKSFVASYKRMKAGQPKPSDLLRYTGMTDFPKVNKTFGQPDPNGTYQIDQQKIPGVSWMFVLVVTANAACVLACLSAICLAALGKTGTAWTAVECAFLCAVFPFVCQAVFVVP